MDAWLHCKMPFYCTRPLKAISSTRKKGGQKLGFTWLGPSLATSENFGAMHVQRHENTLPSGRASFMSCKKNFPYSGRDVLVAYVPPVLVRFRIAPGRRLSRVLDGLTEAAQEQVARSVHGLPQGLALRTAKRAHTVTHTHSHACLFSDTHTHTATEGHARTKDLQVWRPHIQGLFRP